MIKNRKMAKKSTEKLTEYVESAEKAAAKSDDEYRRAVKDYGNTATRTGTNPLLELVPDTADYSRRRDRVAQAATMDAFGQLASVIGGGISAAWGGSPALPDSKRAQKFESQIALDDNRMRKEFDDYRKANLAEAVRKERRQQHVDDKVLESMYRIKRDSQNSYQAAIKESNRMEIARKQYAQRQQLAETAARSRATADKSRLAANRGSERKPETYILDSNNKKVPIYREEMTQLYELAGEFDMLKQYREAKSKEERNEAFLVAITNAYKLKQKILGKIKK